MTLACSIDATTTSTKMKLDHDMETYSPPPTYDNAIFDMENIAANPIEQKIRDDIQPIEIAGEQAQAIIRDKATVHDIIHTYPGRVYLVILVQSTWSLTLALFLSFAYPSTTYGYEFHAHAPAFLAVNTVALFFAYTALHFGYTSSNSFGPGGFCLLAGAAASIILLNIALVAARVLQKQRESQ